MVIKGDGYRWCPCVHSISNICECALLLLLFFFQRCCICVRECVVYYDKKNNKKRIKLKKHCTGNHDTSNRSNSQLLALFSLCHSNSSILIKWASDVSTTSKYSLECNVCRSNHKSQQNCFKRANIWKSFCFCFCFFFVFVGSITNATVTPC